MNADEVAARVARELLIDPAWRGLQPRDAIVPPTKVDTIDAGGGAGRAWLVAREAKSGGYVVLYEERDDTFTLAIENRTGKLQELSSSASLLDVFRGR